MKNILNLRIYTPERLVLEQEVLKLSLSGKEGSFTILPKHVDYISSFTDSIMCYHDLEDNVNFLAVNQGILTKIGRNIEISTFHMINGNSLADLKQKMNEISKNSDNLLSNNVEIDKNLKKIEIMIFKKMLEFKTF